jgi:uncharacterized protein YxeA
MKRTLAVVLTLAIMVIASFTVHGQIDKRIDNDTFSVGSGANFVNVTSNEVTFEDKMYNNSVNLFVYNNATYDQVKMTVSAGPSADGTYPSNVRLDLNNDGKYEYRFSGTGTGQMGNQSQIYDKGYVARNSVDLLPSENGDYVYVKLPSKATVKSLDYKLNHPVEAVFNNVMLDQNTPGLDVTFGYYYGYQYKSSGNAYQGGSIYWYQNYAKFYSLYSSSVYYIPSGYSTAKGYSYIPSSSYEYYRYGYTYNYYMKWDETNSDLIVPPGADLLEYRLVWPFKNYLYSSPYGFSWTTNSNYYYAGEKTYGLYEVTSPWPTDYMYYNDYSSSYGPGCWYAYNYNSLTSMAQSDIEDAMDYNWPGSTNIPVDTYDVPEMFYSSSQKDVSDMSFDIYDVVKGWYDGSTENNGFYVNIYSTPYSTYPEWGASNYVLYHDGYATTSGKPYDKNNGYYYTLGYFINPFYKYSSSYNYLKPRLMVGFSLPSYNAWVDVGDNGNRDYSVDGYLNGTVNVSGSAAPINNYLRSHFPDFVDDYGNEWTYVPIKVGADQAGKVTLRDLQVKYDYDAIVYYNPSTTSGTLTGSVNSATPKSDSGWSLLNINVTVGSKGKLNFKDLEMVGTRSNQRPSMLMAIPDMDVDEGVNDEMLIPISDYITDQEQDSNTLNYIIQENSGSGHVELFLTEAQVRDDKVYLGIDTSMDPDWFGNVSVVISATDSGGKDLWTNRFWINIQPVNDIPMQKKEFSGISLMEGVDDLQVDYVSRFGRGTAYGKWSKVLSGDGTDYFQDVEGDPIYVNFQLLGPDMETVQTIIDENEDGFRIFKGSNDEVTLTVLPPEYTEDPENYVLFLGSDRDYDSASEPYYLAIYGSDNPENPYGQSKIYVPIVIHAVNDEPMIEEITDIMMDEDTTYVSNFDFVERYIKDVDNSLEDLSVVLSSRDPRVMVSLVDNRLHVDPGEDFSGVSVIDITVSDGASETMSSFRVLVRSINDPPTLVVDNVYDGMIVSDIFFIRGTADDIEKNLRSVQLAIVESGDTVSADDWIEVDGTYVWNYMVDIRDFSDGEYDLHIRAYDGNRDFSDEYVVTLNMQNPRKDVDLTPPTVTLDTSLSGVLHDTLEIEGSVSDDSGYLSFVEYRTDSGNWKRAILTDMSTWTAVLDTRMLTNEVHTFSVRAYDGKAYSEAVTVNFEVMNEDSDLDGVKNVDEIDLGMDPFNAIDGPMDFDSDGYSNAVEISKGTDIFDADSHPTDSADESSRVDTWAIVMIVAAVLFALVILGLFVMNIQMDRRIHKWNEELNQRRMDRRPKTLLQKIVDIAPTYKPNVVPLSNVLPGSVQAPHENLPPSPEDLNQ